jgi:hypothetical protein
LRQLANELPPSPESPPEPVPATAAIAGPAQFSHLQANVFKFRACGARRKVRVACGYVREGALPRNIRLAAVTARMFDKYFTGWKSDREAYGGSLASYIEDLGGQTRLGVILCTFDYLDAACALSEYGNRRCDWQSGSSRCQMQKSSTGKLHGIHLLKFYCVQKICETSAHNTSSQSVMMRGNRHSGFMLAAASIGLSP